MFNENPREKYHLVGRRFTDVIEAIDEIGASFPDRIAITHGAAELTYGELRAMSASIANTLRERCAVGAIVGYWGERDPNWAATVIAILKGGSTYLPLDPSLPASRTSFILEQSGCTLIIGKERPETLGLLEQNSHGNREFMTVQTALTGDSAAFVMPSSAERGLAYILFTSGSTGWPKGAMVERAGLNNHLTAKIDALELTEKDCIAQTASHCFDISLWQLLAGLCVGSRVAIIDDATLRSPIALLKALGEQGVTIVQFVPSVLAIFVEYLQTLPVDERPLSALRMISTVGEPLTPALARAWLALYPQVSILNHYGPTECADGVTHHVVSIPPGTADTYVPIGRPISNLEVYVADGWRLCRTGEVGEICVSGVGVAAGYINDCARTKDAFFPNPFSSHPSHRRLYKTGDLGRFRADGLLECLGRRDRQLKIRGHRVELGEIESRLCAHPSVSGAVAIAPVNKGVKLTARDITKADGGARPRRIVAYVSASPEVLESELRSFVAEMLPAYMVPDRIIHVDRIPITRNGKVDFAALPNPTTIRPQLPNSFEDPKTELETKLRDIWSSVLRMKGIGVNDQFMDLGGDSLRAMLVLARLQRQFGAKMDFRLVLNGTVRSLAASLSSRSETAHNVPPAGQKHGRSTLTRVQEHLWFLWQLDPDAKNYIIQGGLRIRGAIDPTAFNQAWIDVVGTHDALSARFSDDGPVQIFDNPHPANLELLHADHLTPQEAGALVAEMRQTELNDAFDLSQGRLFRARMIRFAPDDHLILITAHEIIIDAWSISILLRDLRTRYSNAAPFAPQHRVSLSAYALWEAVHVTPESLVEQQRYWRGQIGDNPPALLLASDRPRPKGNSYRGTSHAVPLGEELSDQVRRFAHRHRCTTSTMLLACFKLLLRMYSGQDDVIVGIPHVVRDQTGTEEIVGFFLNMLPIRTTIDVNKSFVAHVTRVQALVSDAIANSAYPFSWMVRDARLYREAGRSPIFQVMFNMYSEPQESPAERDLDLTFREYDTGYVKFDLTLYAQDQGDEIALQLAYAEDIFSGDLIARMAANLRQLIAACVDSPAEPIVALNCLCPSEVAVLDALKGPEQAYENEPSLVEAFDHVSAKNDRVAYFGEFGEVTFGQLRERMAAIQSALRTCEVGQGDMVAMLIDRSPDVAATTLAIRAMQATVVPISPDYPKERISHIIRDSRAKLLIHASADEEIDFGVPSVSVSSLQARSCPTRASHCEVERRHNHAASLIYTSSSTGKAKGVLIPETAILNRLNWMWRCFPFDDAEVAVVQKSGALVAAAWEYFGGLLRGIPTLILTDEYLLDPDLLLSTLTKHRVTRLFASPPILSGLIASQKRHAQATSLRLVTSSAEPMPPSLPSRWRECFPDVPLWNFYGATECASNAAVYATSETDDGSKVVPVGRPIDNVKIYVLNAKLERVPVGVAGELCIAGRCLSTGYWRDRKRTKQSFVANPYDDGQYGLLYRSGDVARVTAKGLLEICGRSDNQIKLRGFRIELEEIETALEAHPGIARATAVVRGADENRRLVAIVVLTDDSLTSRDMVNHLRQELPPYMIPSEFRIVDHMPLTASGKIDRCRLSSVRSRELRGAQSPEPRTQRERLLAGIWQELLSVTSIGIDDSFFDIGGNSLLSVRCVTSARKAGLSLTVAQLYRTPTIRELAKEIASATTNSAYEVPTGPMRVTPAVSSLNSLVGLGEHYNIGDLFFLSAGVLNLSILEDALAHVIGRHEGIKLRIVQTESGLSQAIGSVPNPLVEEIDLVGMTTAEQLKIIEGACAERQTGFRFDGETPLVRLSAFRTSESGDYYLLVLMHHFVVEGTGYRLFLNALEAAYNTLAAGETIADQETTPLSHWLERLGHYADNEAPTELKYWEGIRYDLFDLHVSDSGAGKAEFLDETARSLHYARLEGLLNEEYCRPFWQDQAKYCLTLGEKETARLLNVSATSAQYEDFDIVLSALSGAFGRAFGNYSLWIDSLTSTRGELFDDIDPSQIIGFVGELVPLPLYLTGKDTPRDRARSIYRQRNALPRRGIGFRAMKFLNRDPAVRKRIDQLPLPRVGLNYRAQLQHHYRRRLLDRDPHSLWIGQNMKQSAMNYLFWFNVGYEAGELQIEVTYDPRQVGYGTTRNLCTILHQELLQIINTFAVAGRSTDYKSVRGDEQGNRKHGSTEKAH